jgi:hypothetical protein
LLAVSNSYIAQHPVEVARLPSATMPDGERKEHYFNSSTVRSSLDSTTSAWNHWQRRSRLSRSRTNWWGHSHLLSSSPTSTSTLTSSDNRRKTRHQIRFKSYVKPLATTVLSSEEDEPVAKVQHRPGAPRRTSRGLALPPGPTGPELNYGDAGDADRACGVPPTRRYSLSLQLERLSDLMESKLQVIISLSTAKAEFYYYSASTGTAEAVWLRDLIRSLGFLRSVQTPPFEDNAVCIEWGNNVIGGRERAKYISIRKHYAHEAIQLGHVRLVRVATAD